MTDITAVADQVRDAQTGYTIYGHNYARLSGKIRIFNLLKSKKWNTFLQLVTLVHCILRVWENDFSAPRKVGDKIDEDETPLWPVVVSAFILAIYICHSVVIILFYGKNLVRWKEFENSGPMRTEFIYLVLSCLFLIDFILLVRFLYKIFNFASYRRFNTALNKECRKFSPVSARFLYSQFVENLATFSKSLRWFRSKCGSSGQPCLDLFSSSALSAFILLQKSTVVLFPAIWRRSVRRIRIY